MHPIIQRILPLLLVSSGFVALVSGCTEHSAPRAEHVGDRVNTTGRSDQGALPRDGRTTDRTEMQFDLVCDLHGRVTTPVSSGSRRGTYPANARDWDYTMRQIVDLAAMQYCESTSCERYGRNSIADLTPEIIEFDRSPGFSAKLRRRDNRYQSRLENESTVSVTTGVCRVEPFSGFPAQSAKAGG